MARTNLRDGAGLPSENAEKEKPKKEVLKIERPQMEQMLRISCGPSSMKDLETLVASFFSQLEPHLSISNKTQETAEEEKRQIKQRLIFFNSMYREIPEPKRNLEYLSKMSDLLAHYIGVEVFTSADPFNADSREGKDLISRIVTTLYTSLDSSEDHVLDTMMKLRAPFEDTPKKDVLVYSELFKIVVKKAQKRQVNDLTYMRYVLVFRLWKKMIKEDAKMKEIVIKKASKRLRPPPKFVKRRSSLPQVLPKPPKKTVNFTEFFLREKFNVRKTVKKFLDETSEATHQSNMFINLSCNPRLLNPKVRDPLPVPDSTIQEFSTFMSTADDVWERLHEEPHSESSIFEQVTNLKRIPICTPNRVFNLLHSHYLIHKARKPGKKKAASRKACFRDRGLVGGIISSHRMNGSLSDAYSLSVQNTADPVIRDSTVGKPHKRRLLESPDILPKKGLWEDDHIQIRSSYVGAGSLRKENGQCKSWLSPSKSLEETTETNLKDAGKIADSGCSSNGNRTADVKSEVKEEPNGWQSGSSCNSVQSFGELEPSGKLAIEKEVEQTLQMLQKSKPTIETSPVKAEGENVENSVVRTTPDVVSDWSSMWGAMGYLGQSQDMSSGDDIWLDELLSYPSSAGPVGQDFWSLIASDEIADYS